MSGSQISSSAATCSACVGAANPSDPFRIESTVAVSPKASDLRLLNIASPSIALVELTRDVESLFNLQRAQIYDPVSFINGTNGAEYILE